MSVATWDFDRRDQSGGRDPQLGITKAGNVYLRGITAVGQRRQECSKTGHCSGCSKAGDPSSPFMDYTIAVRSVLRSRRVTEPFL